MNTVDVCLLRNRAVGLETTSEALLGIQKQLACEEGATDKNEAQELCGQ